MIDFNNKNVYVSNIALSTVPGTWVYANIYEPETKESNKVEKWKHFSNEPDIKESDVR